jgi:hypothetical protein
MLTVDYAATDRFTTVRIAGTLLEVEGELARTTQACAAKGHQLRYLGPVLWGEEYVVHGEIHSKEIT